MRQFFVRNIPRIYNHFTRIDRVSYKRLNVNGVKANISQAVLHPDYL